MSTVSRRAEGRDTERFDALVFIGRFQPFHRAHLHVLRQALARAARVVVLIGSTERPRTIRDPFTYEERRDMIRACLTPQEAPRVLIEALQDSLYNDAVWSRWVQSAVGQALGRVDGLQIGLIGHEKDATSYYLRMFPQWRRLDAEVDDELSATEVRNHLFAERASGFLGWATPEPVHAWLERFRLQPVFAELKAEAAFLDHYRRAWTNTPHPVIFVTVDAVVVHSGHLLLVRRRAAPGRGLWALPGGFLDPEERVEAGCLRELREETGLKLPEPVLRGSLRDRQVFDHLGRSLRGRTLSHAFLFHFATGELPRVKGGDDADKARWFALHEFSTMRALMFEDHYDIAQHFIGKL